MDVADFPDIKVVFFDMGGVYVTDNVKPAYEKHGIKYTDDQRWPWRLCRLGKKDIRSCFALGAYNHTCSLAQKERAKFVDDIVAEATNLIQWQPDGAKPLVMTLKMQGYRVGVLANHSLEWAALIREKFEVAEIFDPAITLFSAEIGLDKNAHDPCVYIYAAERANTEPKNPVQPNNILLIDNEEDNTRMAIKAGWHAELFTNRENARQTLRDKYGIDVGPTKLK